MVIFPTKHLLSPEVLPFLAKASTWGQQKATRHLPVRVWVLSWRARADTALTQGVLVLSPVSSDPCLEFLRVLWEPHTHEINVC